MSPFRRVTYDEKAFEKCMSEKCNQPLLPGQMVLQMARGKCYLGHYTPTYDGPVIGEWHVRCFDEFRLEPQTLPYKCLRCDLPIDHGTEVFYISRGTKPALGYTRPESRGYVQQWLIHANCESAAKAA